MKYSWLVIVLATLLTLTGCGRSTNEEASEGVAIPTAAPRMTPGSALDSAAGAVAAQPTATAAESSAAAAEPTATAATATEPEPTATEEPTATTAPTTEAATTEAATAEPEPTVIDETSAITETADLTDTAEVSATASVSETAPATEEITSTAATTATTEVADSAAVTETAAVDASTEVSATEGVTETGSTEGAAATETLEIKMNDLYFGDSMDNIVNPPVWTVTSGAQVALDLENMGSVDHNWALVKADEEVPVPFDAAKNSDMLLFDPGVVSGGESKIVTYTAPIPGVYTVICTVPGHYPVMQGRLEVK